jgi:glycerophosphoryl diester phosphodiesterase
MHDVDHSARIGRVMMSQRKGNARMKALTAVLVFWALFTSSASAADADAIDVGGRPRIVAHRGASAERPEDTLCAIGRAIEAGAQVVEIDVRASKDGILFLLHDPTLDRTTDGTGPAAERTMAELKKLDAGAWFNEAYRGEPIPTLGQALELCRGKIDVLLDLKEQGETYASAVARDVQAYGDATRTIAGVRSVEQARRFRRLLPRSPQLGFILNPEEIEAFAALNVEAIRLWPRWLTSAAGASIVERVRSSGARLQLNGQTGTPREILPLLRYMPDLLLVDDPAMLKATLEAAKRHTQQFARLSERVKWLSETTVVPWIAKTGAATFLNRDYSMLELPKTLEDQPRLMFAGGEGDCVVLRFAKPTVVFAAFEYNSTGGWSFPERRLPKDFGWRLVKKDGYRGTSNGNLDGKPHFAGVYCRIFKPGEQLDGLPPWWLCLAIVDPETAADVPGFSQAMSGEPSAPPPFLHSQWATRERPLRIPDVRGSEQWSAWQRTMREDFRQRLVFSYDAPATIVQIGRPTERDGFTQQELHVLSDGQRLFRFFKLTPKSAGPSASARPLATIVCFMGHGKVQQILEEPDSYQHACAARFAEQGYLVFAMENVGMEPDRDTHHELDRLLRLDGYGWYSLLFAHQQMLLDHVFADPMVDGTKVGVTGVSTGGLLTLSAIAMDPRVAAASVQGIFGSMRVSFIRDRNRHCPCGAIPGLLPDFDLPEMALLAAPRPLHISNAVQDGFGPDEARRCIERITPHYRKAGGQAPRFSMPPGRHEYAFDPALKFFEDTIGKPE